jgi:predicted HTH transcriptional regulator
MIWTGVRASRQIHKVVTKRKAADAGIALPKKEIRPETAAVDPTGENEVDEPVAEENIRVSEEQKQQVLDYLKTTKYVKNETCRNLTGLSKPQVHRLLIDL